mmetsp:Transcript_30183/g.39764  ORF Transcript_30183/g.39764 Transcript_30183/m.39764 type:complete len:121 (-) Transcript_30183:245-607(-)|eukprot:CAMPEP_0117816386 /NCGR_PEP_ID=MMETSP0949-20121206/15_1 /TAXON_ID=44440 /ORGANISM="Chattonella subsalsa, Strain CCMP2191" /LENGTH=120 /DNA_ID=CAMNT_0005654487 /DNA_START=92 /DNA_END=454 /DNA_ORIENTATION=+
MNMFAKIFAFCLVLGVAAAFVPQTNFAGQVSTVRSPLSMSMSMDNKAVGAFAAATAPFVASSQVLATEGTGEALGFEGPIFNYILFGIYLAIGSVWFQWASKQPDNEADFFGEYDQRRTK